ncbi:glutathione S-transferase family protein|uniref:glutathione S-transferase family protein n=1 Tax=Noviherbaspirillum sp. L7-7A TaxID=2850560 RepID=UPI001C2C4B3B|nr:glutathione S-transferase family protein [Noviherbaspirillum sp. L7-7A]MBV0878793.1 glutathione S-transferase family protein [Noviherbaspirillum sp. L7-7A]
MTDIILHHYPTSPFAEKVRRVLAWKKLPWKSVIIPIMMPKPDLLPLTGGYRRTPVMQVGADVYCDTALICAVLERIAPSPSLYPAPVAGQARLLAQWADSTLFWTVIPHVFQPAGVQSVLGHLTPEQMQAFSADRAAMRGNAPRMHPGDAAAALQQYLRWLEDMLAHGQPWLLGEEASIADFSAYHCLWFLRNATAVAGILDQFAGLRKWMNSIDALPLAAPEKLGAEGALQIANTSTPATPGAAFVDTHGIAPGTLVTVTPADYAQDPVAGELVAATDSEYAVRRKDDRAGEVVVHFPRIGYQLRRAQ